MLRRRRLTTTAAAVVLTAAIFSACSSGGSSGSGGSSSATTIGNGNSNSSTTVATGKKEAGGTLTVASDQGNPNFIFPLPPATNTDGYNVNLSQPLWPYLAFPGDGAKSAVGPEESLYSSLKYTDGDKTITIVLKPWKWSNGTPITSRDFTFLYNLLKANKTDWEAYIAGLFPDNVSSVATPDSKTIVIHLSKAFNPTFYTDNVLTLLPLLPQQSWDKESASGPVGNYDETTAGAKAVWKFLQKEGGDIATFATNPLWKVVDGPWTLTSFRSDGYYSYAPNKAYSGPAKPTLSSWVEQPYTTDTAEFDALRAGGTLDLGGLPQNDLGQIASLKSEGYSIADVPIPGVAGIIPNFYSPKVGGLLQQLYIRQAMEELINRPQIVSKVYGGYADPGNGPVPTKAFPDLGSSLEKSGGPYPYDPSKAVALLKAHGWAVHPGKASTCADAGTAADQCGAGVTKGESLSLVLAYSSGTASVDDMEAAIQSSESQAGVDITLKSEPFNTLIGDTGTCNASSHPAATCSWQLVDFGYDPYQLYPSGDGLFNSDAVNNQGGYSSAEMNKLIDETEFGSSSQAFFSYENYAAKQLPWLWLPDSDELLVYKSNLVGVTPLNPFSAGLNPEVWYYTTGS